MDMGNSAFEVSPYMPTFSLSSMHEINVLLVEHDGEDKDKTINLLERFSLKVTTVNRASMALSILSKEKTLFDLVIVDMRSCHSSYISRLLQETLNSNLTVILMCDEVNVDTTLWGLENGARLSIKKPMSMEVMGCLWQLVVRDRLGTFKDREEFKDAAEDFVVQEKEFVNEDDNDKEAQYYENPNLEALQLDNPMLMRRKVWTEWTEELHEKFMYAVSQLGEGRCYPKEILELMNVPGLTRMQVASHLQKCRNAKWLPPNKRKSKLANMEKMTYMKSKAPRSKTVRFGSMPRLDDNDPDFHSGMQEYHENQQEFIIGQPSPINNNNVVGDDNNEGTFDNLYYSQLVADQANYPFSQPNDAFNMAPLGHEFGYSEPIIYGAQSVDSSANSTTNQRDFVEEAFGFSYMDPMVQNLPPALGEDYNGSLQSVVQDRQVPYNKLPFGMTNSSANNWGWEVHNEW